MATRRKSAVKKKPAAKKSAVKRRISVKRGSKARQRALDTAVTGGKKTSPPAPAAGAIIRLPANPKSAAKKKSLGQRIRRFVEKQLG